MLGKLIGKLLDGLGLMGHGLLEAGDPFVGVAHSCKLHGRAAPFAGRLATAGLMSSKALCLRRHTQREPGIPSRKTLVQVHHQAGGKERRQKVDEGHSQEAREQ
ncbi:hypothetical protein D3C87_1943310 [compost metagenome]